MIIKCCRFFINLKKDYIKCVTHTQQTAVATDLTSSKVGKEEIILVIIIKIISNLYYISISLLIPME